LFCSPELFGRFGPAPAVFSLPRLPAAKKHARVFYTSPPKNVLRFLKRLRGSFAAVPAFPTTDGKNFFRPLDKGAGQRYNNINFTTQMQ
jgi:hypothetical protein